MSQSDYDEYKEGHQAGEEVAEELEEASTMEIAEGQLKRLLIENPYAGRTSIGTTCMASSPARELSLMHSLAVSLTRSATMKNPIAALAPGFVQLTDYGNALSRLP